MAADKSRNGKSKSFEAGKTGTNGKGKGHSDFPSGSDHKDSAASVGSTSRSEGALKFSSIAAAGTDGSGNGQGKVAEAAPSRRVWREYTDPEIASRISEVPPEPRPFSADAPRAGFESGIIFALFAIIYGVVGYFMLTDARIVDFVSLNHLNSGYMVFWNDPPRLAAIGFNPGTLSAILFMPFSIIKPFATSLVALPVMSALAGGLLMATLNSMLRNCDISLVFRVVLLVLFGLNPLLVFKAASGDPNVLTLVLVGITLASIISWSMTDQTRHLATAGLATGIGVMVDYGFLLFGFGLMIALLMISAANKDDGLKVRSSLLLFLTPIAYVLLFWCLLNWVLLGNPFDWVTAHNGVIQVNTSGALDSLTTDFWGSLGDLFEVTLGVAPLAMLAAVALIVVGFLRKDMTSWGLLVVGICMALVPVLRAVGADQANLFILEYGLPLAIFAMVAVAWTGRDGWGTFAVVAMTIGLIAAIPLSWDAMKNYQFQNQEQAFTRWVETRDSQEGTESLGDYQVGIDPELAMAEYINNSIPNERRSVLVDENFSYGVMITSGRPQNFYDRVDNGEGKWQSVIDNPYGKVSYMLVTTSREGDQIAKKWPTAVQGAVPGLTPVFRTDRYVLLEVADEQPSQADVDPDDPTAPRTEPNLVTPSTPIDPTGPSVTTPSTTPSTSGESSTGASPTDQTPTSPSFGGNNNAVEPNNGNSSAPTVEGE